MVGLQFLGTLVIPLALNSKEDEYRVEAEVRGTYVVPSSLRGADPRPGLQFVNLQREEIEDVYLGKKADRARVLEIFERYGVGPRMHDAYY